MTIQSGELVQAAVMGDEAAFTELVARHHRDLLRVAYVICRDPALAEDSAQAAWAIAWRRLGDVKEPGRVRSWLVAVAANEAAGAVIIGKANMCEFALCWETTSSLGGQTLSPYDTGRDPGGSSGGTAVAVAANFAAVGLGTDTCGSIRLPASLNNLYGLRPTSGLSSRAGVIPFSPTLDTVGPMARSVVDLAIVLDTTVGVDPADPTTVRVSSSYLGAVDPNGLAGRRIGLVTFSGDSEVVRVDRAAVDEMRANGVAVVEVALPGGVDIDPLFDELRSALDGYLAAQPGAPVRSLAAILVLNLHEPAVVDAYLRERAAVTGLDTGAYHASLAGRRNCQILWMRPGQAAAPSSMIGSSGRGSLLSCS